jgi:uncharacterized protein YeaO (DUF488 family)
LLEGPLNSIKSREPMIRIKRVYESVQPDDGWRIVVERLWPRGVRKEALDADADAWLKDVAPSTALRKWFGHREERWDEFRRRYRKELSANPDSWSSILSADKRGTVTLLYSARDREHNGAVVLRQYLIERSQTRASKSKQSNSRQSISLTKRGTEHLSRSGHGNPTGTRTLGR